MQTESRWGRDELLRIIREVRARWRWKVALRSLTVVVAAGILTLLAAAFGLEQFRFSPAAILTFRIVTYVVLVAVGWFVLVRPVARHVSDQQVALYLEEHEPELDALLVSAVDAGTADRPVDPAHESVPLLRKVIEAAVEKCREAEFGRRMEQQSVRRSYGLLAAVAAAAALIYMAGPAYLRHGALALLLPVRNVEAASPYRIDVKPGHATVARGSDVAVSAKLVGFAADEVYLFTRAGAGAPFEKLPLVAAETGDGFDGMLFNLRQSVEYFVESAGVRSAVFKIDVADLPHVERLELEYVFPPHTGLPPQKIEDGGDIAVLRGTTVRMRVHATMKTAGGQVVRDERDRDALSAEPDGTLTGSFVVAKDGFYRIELQSPAGTLVTASRQYTIDVLADSPPTVSFSKPGRDLRPSNIDEVFVEAKANDDFGIGRLDLVYSVNGGSERTKRLFAGGTQPLKSVTAGHTFFLEELNLKAGDVVSYYARATDNDAVQGGKSVTSDIYFLQIRPFRKDYRAAESQAGMQGGGQQGNQAGALSEQQRRIITATFNVQRDRDRKSADQFRDDVVFVTLAQGQLRERVETLVTQITTRVADADPEMKQVSDLLGEAAKAMRAAEGRLQARSPKDALPPEQQALASLQRAEEVYKDVRVMLSNQAGGGGGQQSDAMAEELADLFQLELDKLRNQYETVQRGQQQSADNRLDEMLERLKELARRQEQEAERQRQLAGTRQQGGGGAGSARQRQLAEETEEAARQLERLSREAGRQDLADAARRMQEAADAMRRAAAQGDQNAFAEASAAAERLRQAQQRLEQQRSDRMARDIQDALDRVQRLQDEQRQVESDVRSLGQSGADRGQQVPRLMERKDTQAGEVADIERQLDRTASDFRRERAEASRKVQDAADAIRDNKLKEKIRYSKGLVQGAPPDAAASFEEQIGADLDTLAQRLRDAASAVGAPDRDRRAEALERARDLVRGMESMDQRLRQRGQAGQAEPEGQEGQEAERGQQSQQGQRGQQGGQAQGGQMEGDPNQRDPRGQGGVQMQPPRSAGSLGSTRPGNRPLTPDEARQFQREWRERSADAQQLRRDLQALGGVEVGDLDRLIRDLRALENERALANPQGLAELQASLVEGFRRFEFALRRQLGAAGADALFLSGTEEAPAAYRKLIEEYYRQLAKEKKK